MPGGCAGQRPQDGAFPARCRAVGAPGLLQRHQRTSSHKADPGERKYDMSFHFKGLFTPTVGFSTVSVVMSCVCANGAGLLWPPLASDAGPVPTLPPILPKSRAHLKPREERNFLRRINKPFSLPCLCCCGEGTPYLGAPKEGSVVSGHGPATGQRGHLAEHGEEPWPLLLLSSSPLA